MLSSVKKRSRNLNKQLVFSWGEPNNPRRTKQPPTPKVRQQKTPEQAAPTALAAQSELQELCLLLHQLAQKYVTRSNFQDFDLLVQCTHLLQEKQITPPITADLVSPVANYNPAVVTSAPQYRLMRNRAMAALATIADLSHKAPSKGSPDYQQGMRDGFETASNIAVFFLEDLEAAYEFRR